jgi:nitrogen regulatory protein P-II 1
MRAIKAFIRRNMADEVVMALRNAGFMSTSMSDVEGTGKFTTGDVQIFNLPANYSKMTKLEIVCKKEDVVSIIEVIHKYGSTGEKGDGMIYVSEVIKVFKIRTGLESLEDIAKSEKK